MIRRIAGDENTRSLIGNIVKDFRSSKPTTKYVDYSISKGKYSSLPTDEYRGEPRNVSIIYLKGIEAAIGNKTGNILINRKSLFISTKKAIKNIQEFLQNIQPAKIRQGEVISSEYGVLNKPIDPTLSPGFVKKSQTISVDGEIYKKTVIGDNNISVGECIEEYKTL